MPDEGGSLENVFQKSAILIQKLFLGPIVEQSLCE